MSNTQKPPSNSTKSDSGESSSSSATPEPQPLTPWECEAVIDAWLHTRLDNADTEDNFLLLITGTSEVNRRLLIAAFRRRLDHYKTQAHRSTL